MELKNHLLQTVSCFQLLQAWQSSQLPRAAKRQWSLLPALPIRSPTRSGWQMRKEGAGGKRASPPICSLCHSPREACRGSQAQTPSALTGSLPQLRCFSGQEQPRRCQVGKTQFCLCYLFRSLVTALALMEDEHLPLLFLYLSII